MAESSHMQWSDRRLVAARSALEASDAGPALAMVAGVRNDPQLRAHYVETLATAANKALPALGAQLEKDPDDPDAWLLLGAALSVTSTRARGGDVIARTSDEQIQAMLHYSGLAREALLRAADLLPSDPVPWCELLICATFARRYDGEAADVWATVVERGGGDIFSANSSRLLSLTRKWGGSERECFGFARERTRDLPAGHPLLALVALAYVEAMVERRTRTSRKIVLMWHLLFYLRKNTIRRAEIDAASDYLLEGTDDYLHHPATMAAHQAFACLYHKAYAHDRARPHLERAGERSTGWPWVYFGDRDEGFAEARLAAGLPAL